MEGLKVKLITDYWSWEGKQQQKKEWVDGRKDRFLTAIARSAASITSGRTEERIERKRNKKRTKPEQILKQWTLKIRTLPQIPHTNCKFKFCLQFCYAHTRVNDHMLNLLKKTKLLTAGH